MDHPFKCFSTDCFYLWFFFTRHRRKKRRYSSVPLSAPITVTVNQPSKWNEAIINKPVIFLPGHVKMSAVRTLNSTGIILFPLFYDNRWNFSYFLQKSLMPKCSLLTQISQISHPILTITFASPNSICVTRKCVKIRVHSSGTANFQIV